MTAKRKVSDEECEQLRAQDCGRLKLAAEQLLTSKGWQRCVRVRSQGGLARLSLSKLGLAVKRRGADRPVRWGVCRSERRVITVPPPDQSPNAEVALLAHDVAHALATATQATGASARSASSSAHLHGARQVRARRRGGVGALHRLMRGRR